MQQMPFPERCDPCLIWGQIMQISGAHQWFHDIAPFANGIKKKTVLTPCFKICCLWYIPSHFLSHFSFGQMTQIVRRHQQPALCGTHQSQVCHCWCISIFNTNTTNRYKSIHTYVCGSSVVFWNSLVSIPCFYPLWCWWHKKIITSLFPPSLSFGSCVCKKGVSVNPGIPLKCERVWALLSDNYRSKSWLYHCSRQLFPFPGFSFRIRYEDLVEDL